MNEPMRSFDDRSHMRTAGQPRAATPDPLAELARLVGQDDPFRDIFGDAKRAAEPPAVPTDDTSWLEAALRPSYPTESEPHSADPEPLPAFGYSEPQQAAFAAHADEPEHGLGPDISLRKRSGGVLAAGTLLGLAVIGGIGLFAFRDGMSGDAAPGTPPLIRAEPGPNKTIPVAAEAADTPQHNKLIYDRVGGVEPKVDGKVMSRVEEPVELPPAEPRSTAPAPDAAASPEPALRGGTPEQTGTAPGSEPRRVRTVLIKPDGLGTEPTLAAPSQSAAPAPAAPSAPAAAPPAPAAAAVGNPAPAFERPRGYPFSIVEEEPAAPAPPPSSASAAASTGPAPVPPPKPAAPATSVVRSPTIAPAEAPRPAAAAQQPARPAAAPPPPAAQAQTRVAALPPAVQPAPARPAPAAAASGGTSRFAVQLTSQRSEQEARAAYSGLQRRFGSLLAPYQPSIQKADLGSRGIFYRVRVAAESREDAVKLCTSLKAQGGDCVVQAN